MIHFESPVEVAIFPSRLAAAFTVTHGRPVRIALKNGRFSASACSRSTPVITSTPPRRSRATPLPSTSGFGSADAQITRRTPASRIATEHGGVFP